MNIPEGVVGAVNAVKRALVYDDRNGRLFPNSPYWKMSDANDNYIKKHGVPKTNEEYIAMQRDPEYSNNMQDMMTGVVMSANGGMTAPAKGAGQTAFQKGVQDIAEWQSGTLTTGGARQVVDIPRGNMVAEQIPTKILGRPKVYNSMAQAKQAALRIPSQEGAVHMIQAQHPSVLDMLKQRFAELTKHGADTTNVQKAIEKEIQAMQ